MLKKQSLLLMLGMATATAYAHPPVFSGLYLGANVGGFYDAAKLDTTVRAVVANEGGDEFTTLTSAQDLRIWRGSLTGSLVLGFGGYICPKFHLAGEIYYSLADRYAYLNNLTSLAVIEDNFYAYLNTKTTAHLHKGEFGIDLLPGYLFESQTLFYGRLGVGFNRLNISSDSLLTDVGNIEGDTIYLYSPLALSENSTKHPLRLGFGLEHLFCPHLSVSVDYIYSYYGHAGTTALGDTVTFVDGDIIPAPNGFFSSASTRLYTQTLTLGVKYYFL